MPTLRLLLALWVIIAALPFSPRTAATTQTPELKIPTPVTVGRTGVTLTPMTIPPGCTLQPLADNKLLTFEPAAGGQSGTLKPKYPVVTTSGEQQTTIKLECKKADNVPVQSNDIVVNIKRKARNLHLVTLKRNAAGSTTETVVPPDNLLPMLQGDSLQVRAVYDDEEDGTRVPLNKIEVRGDASSVADVTPGEPPTLKALNPSDKLASFTVRLEGDDAPRPELAFKVKVLSTVSAIVVENGQSLSLPEGDNVTLKLKITGPNGETYKLSERADITIDDQPKGVVNISKNEDSVVLTALPLPAGATTPNTAPRTTIKFQTLRGLGGKEVFQDVTVTVTEKFGYITFEPPPRGLLLPSGSFATTAIVRDKAGAVQYGQGVEYQLENQNDSKWVTLAPEGNKLNVYWAEPADKNENRNRPSSVTVKATARPPRGGVINGYIFVRMGEVAKFAPLRVKLDVMDQRTAQDLYGGVTSDEYYVLTVRLFNNLKDQETNEFTGASILAYSSSIEVAVGMEKKFDRDSDTDFPNVIGKDAANRIAKERSQAAENIALSQAQADIAAAQSGHKELLDAAAAQRTAEQESARLKEVFYQRRKEAVEKSDAAARLRQKAGAEREQAERLIEIARRRRQSATDQRRNAGDDPERIARAERTAREAAQAEREAAAAQKEVETADGRAESAQDEWEAAEVAARTAFNNANAQVEAVRLAYDRTAGARDSIARANRARTPISQALATKGDPDTAYDDGRWRPISPDDFMRITKPKEEPDFRRNLYTEKIPDSALAGLTASADNSGEAPGNAAAEAKPREGNEEPTCVGTTTYRPFTFEMMVNTVDRRDGRSKRSLAFKLLEAVGTGASFVTAVAVPGPSSDLPLGLEKFRNLLIPSADRLFPSLKEQQRQNIVSQAMKEIEEIPFGSDVTRVIFIPKKPMRGIVKGHEARISEVCPYYFKIEVAIVKKGGVVEQGTLSR